MVTGGGVRPGSLAGAVSGMTVSEEAGLVKGVQHRMEMERLETYLMVCSSCGLAVTVGGALT